MNFPSKGGFMFFRLALLVSIAFFLNNCGFKSDNNPTPANNEPKYYTESESQQEANKVSQEIGINIDIANEKDFQNEYKYNRVLQILKRNKEVIIKNNTDLEKIYLSSEANSSIYVSFTVTNKAVVQIGLNVTESELVSFFKEELKLRKKETILMAELKLAINLKIVDHIGINSDNLPAIKEKLIMLAKDVNFNQDPSFRTLEIGRSFLTTSEGLIIDINADYATILSNVKETIEMKLRASRDVAQVLAQVGVSITIQDGVFNPFELNQVLKFITDNAVLISTNSGEFKYVIIGKRWDFNLRSNTILIDYKANSESIREKLTSLNIKKDDSNYLSSAESIKKTLEVSGISLEAVIINLPKTSASMLDLKNSLTYLNTPTFISYLKSLGVKIINLNNLESRYVYGTKVLFIKVPLDSTFEQKLKNDLLVNNILLLKTELRTISTTKRVTLEMEETVSTEAYLEDLKSLKLFLAEHLDANTVSAVKLVTIKTTSAQGSKTQFTNGTLTISFADFDPAKTAELLKTFISENTTVIP
jgi:hypothetical protein